VVRAPILFGHSTVTASVFSRHDQKNNELFSSAMRPIDPVAASCGDGDVMAPMLDEELRLSLSFQRW
jgi:hypothetical protein